MLDSARTRPLVEFWWLRLPLAARRLSTGTVVALFDGLYLAAWPRVAFLASPVALLLGLLFGWSHWTFAEVFSQSLIVLLLAVIFGVASGQLGALFLIGFALGDFFLWHTEWQYAGSFVQGLLRVRVPLLIEYALLAVLTTKVPVITKALVSQLRPPPALGRPLRLVVALVGHLLITLILVYLWAQIVPILIRPVFTWRGTSPPTDAMQIVQRQLWPLVVVAGLVAVGRLVLQWLTATRPVYAARIDALEAQIARVEPAQSWTVRLPVQGRIVITAVWATLFLSGMYTAWYDGLLLGALILVVQAARAGLIPLPLGAWPRLIIRVPILIRLIAGAAIVYILSRAILQQQMFVTNTFRPFLILTALALFVFFFLNPLQPGMRRSEEA